MTTHVRFHEDTNGDLIDVDYFCSALCYTNATGRPAYGHAYPAPSWPDYPVECAYCGQWLHGKGSAPNV